MKPSNNKSSFLGKIVFTGVVLILLYAFFNSIIGDVFLKKYGVCVKAILYGKTFGGKTKPSLKYNFFSNEKNHTGFVTQDEKLKIGDSICIIYLASFAEVNRPLSYFDSGMIKCNCK